MSLPLFQPNQRVRLVVDRLAAGLLKIKAYDFPIQTTDASPEYFARMAPLTPGAMGQAMAAFARDPSNIKAVAVHAHHLRGHPDQWRPCHQRLAPTRRCQC